MLPALSEFAKRGFVQRPIMERRGIEVSTIRPDDGVHFRQIGRLLHVGRHARRRQRRGCRLV